MAGFGRDVVGEVGPVSEIGGDLQAGGGVRGDHKPGVEPGRAGQTGGVKQRRAGDDDFGSTANCVATGVVQIGDVSIVQVIKPPIEVKAILAACE